MASDSGAWMPLYIGDYLADTMHLSGPEHGAYLLLIMHYWRNGPLPDDDKSLAAIARTDRKDWPAISETVREFFRKDATDNRLHHKRIDAELSAANAIVLQKRAAANARWKRQDSARNADAYADASHVHPSRISPSPSPSPKEAKQDARVNGSRHPANGAGPPRWPDTRIVESEGRPCCNGIYVDTVSEKFAEAAGLPLVPLADKTMLGWLADGYDSDEILPVIRRVMERAGHIPKSLAYFDKAVREAAPTWHPLDQSKGTRNAA